MDLPELGSGSSGDALVAGSGGASEAAVDVVFLLSPTLGLLLLLLLLVVVVLLGSVPGSDIITSPSMSNLLRLRPSAPLVALTPMVPATPLKLAEPALLTELPISAFAIGCRICCT